LSFRAQAPNVLQPAMRRVATTAKWSNGHTIPSLPCKACSPSRVATHVRSMTIPVALSDGVCSTQSIWQDLPSAWAPVRGPRDGRIVVVKGGRSVEPLYRVHCCPTVTRLPFLQKGLMHTVQLLLYHCCCTCTTAAVPLVLLAS
jgi:hypothetical protein